MIPVDQIKLKVSLRSLLQADGHKIICTGSIARILCPFHREKTPSCVVYEDHLFCYGCNRRADVIDYIQHRDRCSFFQAIDRLSNGPVRRGYIPNKTLELPKDSPEVDIDFRSLLDSWAKDTRDEQVQQLANSLGVYHDALNVLQVAWCDDKSSWAIPMCDSDKNIVGIRMRTMAGKKFAVTGSRDGLFIPTSFTRIDTLFITEGPTDCAACLSLGFYAIGRANALSNACREQCGEFVKKNRVREVVVVADNDQAGRDGAIKLRKAIPVRSKQLLFPSKDLRNFVKIGGGKQTIQNMLKAQLAKQL